ncbi:MAG: M67 family metallopeptidase [Chloroflexi bacterium]|nr:M67 family metallopeptidase [Chloroflexota bacterium]
MPVAVKLSRAHLDAMIAHALEDAPVECCGVIAAKDGRVVALYRAKNIEGSPYRFKLDPLETRRIESAIDDAGTTLAGFYHSHTGSEPRPSPTDIRSMGPFFGPPYVHFVIGVAERDKPEARVFHIEDGAAFEQEYEVID